jgi:hypothetical protein
MMLGVYVKRMNAHKAELVNNYQKSNCLNCYYAVWTVCKNSDRRINKCLYQFGVLQKTISNSLKMT